MQNKQRNKRTEMKEEVLNSMLITISMHKTNQFAIGQSKLNYLE